MKVEVDPKRHQPTLWLDSEAEIEQLERLALKAEAALRTSRGQRSVASYAIKAANDYRGEGVNGQFAGEAVGFTGMDFHNLVDLLESFPTLCPEISSEGNRMVARYFRDTVRLQYQQQEDGVLYAA